MRYETPNMDILICGIGNIVRTSNPEEGGSGSGPSVEGDDWA